MSARHEDIENYNAAFDLVRGIAAFSVFIAHTCKFLIFGEAPLNERGFLFFEVIAAYSVEFFFALSGILLGRVLYRQFSRPYLKENIRVFVIRRWMRTLPVYYLCLLLYIVYCWWGDFALPENLPAYFVFLQSPFYFNTQFFGVSWSLCIEEFFYVIFPLLVGIAFYLGASNKKAFIIASVSLIVFCFITRQLYLPHIEGWLNDLRTGSFFRLDAIAVGVICGVFLSNYARAAMPYALGFMIVCAVFWAVFGGGFLSSVPLHRYILQISFTLLPWACSIIVLYIAQLQYIKGNKAVTFFADISFSLYVFHMFIMIVLCGGSVTIQPLWFVLLYMVVCVIGAVIVFKYVETPILLRRPKYKK